MDVTDPFTSQLLHCTRRSPTTCSSLVSHGIITTGNSSLAAHLEDRDFAHERAEQQLRGAIAVHVACRVRIRQDLGVQLRHVRRRELKL